jgi:hypothetical protein
LKVSITGIARPTAPRINVTTRGVEKKSTIFARHSFL